ncbi:SMP-30/gluconolactonase/LRE family protein [Agreia sp. PsM10]|nr:SMP-30/gluconolactonase/LRE family protein [Agreia sp. PsM10]
MAGSDSAGSSAMQGTWAGLASVFHGEGAFWDSRAEVFRYVDMLAGDVITDPAGEQSRTHIGEVAALIRRRTRGGYVVADERGFVLLDDELQLQQRVPVFGDMSVRMNEGACDSAGRLFCGSMAYDTRPGAGSLYRLDPDLSVHVVLENVTVPNGLVWMRDGTLGVHVDSADDAVYGYEFDAERGEFGLRDVFIDFSDVHGSPDGMALDEQGGLWIAMWGGGAVRRYDSSGVLTDVLELPVTNVTSCAFGGENGSTLLVTTSRDGIEEGTEPLAGLTYSVDVGVRGAPVHPFAG